MVSDKEVMQAMLTVKTYCSERRMCNNCKPSLAGGCPNIFGSAPYTWSWISQKAVDALDVTEDK